MAEPLAPASQEPQTAQGAADAPTATTPAHAAQDFHSHEFREDHIQVDEVSTSAMEQREGFGHCNVREEGTFLSGTMRPEPNRAHGTLSRLPAHC